MIIIPQQNNILLEKIEKNTGSLIMPENYKSQEFTYRVKAISKDIPPNLYSFKVGDEVLAVVNHSYPLDSLLGVRLTLVSYMQVICVVDRGVDISKN
jgi:co-chaperonin GroES (HSP10)